MEPTGSAEPPSGQVWRVARRRSSLLAGSGLAYLGYPRMAWVGLLAVGALVGGMAAFAVLFTPVALWVAAGGLVAGGALTLVECLAVAFVPVRPGHGEDWVSRHFGWLCLAVYVAAAGALVLLVVQVRPWALPGEGMAPTLPEGTLLLRHRPIGPPDLAAGRLVAFRRPEGASWGRPGEALLGRVLAGPDDRIAIREGHYEVNGRRGPGVSDTADRTVVLAVPLAPAALTVPTDCWFVSSDNPQAGPDGRLLGWVRPGDVVATRFLRLSGRGGLLNEVD